MKKVKLVISGDVQDVGFRLCLLKEAQKLSIPKFFADNLPDKTVLALVGGKQRVVDQYVETVKGMGEGNPRTVQVEVEKYEGDIRSIRDFVDYLHTEQLIKGVVVVGGLGNKLDTLDTTLKAVGQQFADSVSNSFGQLDRRLDEMPKKVADQLDK